MKSDTLFDLIQKGISLDDIYRSLDLFRDYSDSLQKLIWEETSAFIPEMHPPATTTAPTTIFESRIRMRTELMKMEKSLKKA